MLLPWRNIEKWAARKLGHPPMPEAKSIVRLGVNIILQTSKAGFFKGGGKWDG